MPKPKKTRRGGVKHRTRRMLTEFASKPANPRYSELVGTSLDYRNDTEYEEQFREYNFSFDRREGYNAKVAWPYKLTPIASPPVPAVPVDNFCGADPRRSAYATPREIRPLTCDYCGAYLQRCTF